MTAAATPIGTSRPARPSRLLRNASVAAVVVVMAWAVLSIGIPVDELSGLPSGVWGVVQRMFFRPGPDLSYLATSLEFMFQSIQIAWVGTIIGAIFSLPIGFFGAKNVSSGLVSNVIRQVLNGVRAFPELVLAVAIFIPIAGLGPVAGALAIGIHSIGTLGKLTAEVVEGIDPGPLEAARSTGARSLQVMRWGVLPQVLPEIVAFWLYRFEINIRAAAVLGVVGAGGIGFLLQNTVQYTRFDKAGMAIIVVVVATIAVDSASGWLRRRIIEGSEKKAVRVEVFEAPEARKGDTSFR